MLNRRNSRWPRSRNRSCAIRLRSSRGCRLASRSHARLVALDAMNNVGSALRIAREAAGIKLVRLAEQLGVSPNFLGDVERGNRALPRKYYALLPPALHVAVLEARLVEHRKAIVELEDNLAALGGSCDQSAASPTRSIFVAIVSCGGRPAHAGSTTAPEREATISLSLHTGAAVRDRLGVPTCPTCGT